MAPAPDASLYGIIYFIKSNPVYSTIRLQPAGSSQVSQCDIAFQLTPDPVSSMMNPGPGNCLYDPIQISAAIKWQGKTFQPSVISYSPQ